MPIRHPDDCVDAAPPDTGPGLPQRLVSPPRQQRGHARQQALIDAGLRLTATRRWADVTVADIAAAIGCSVGTFYTRFHNKDAYFEVLLGLVAEQLQQRADAFFGDPRRGQETATAFVQAWVSLVVRSFAIHRGLYAAALVQAHAGDPASVATSPLGQLRQRHLAQFSQALGRLGRWRGASAQRRLAFAHQAVQGVLVHAVLTDPGPLRLDEPQLCGELATMLIRYLALDVPPAAA